MDNLIKLGRKIAEKMDGNQRIVAFGLDRRGKILSIGKNSYIKTHPMQAKFARECGQKERIYLHAELAALLRWDKPVYKLFVARFDKKGATKLAAPCKICQRAIRAFGVKTVEYTL